MNWQYWIGMLAMLFSTLGVAGLFWTGGFLGVPILSYLPLGVHKFAAGLIWIVDLVWVVGMFSGKGMSMFR